MDENEKQNTPPHRTGNVLPTGKPALTATETIELRRLFDVTADTCDLAGEILRGPASARGSDLERLRLLTVRIDAMIDGIKAILG